MKNIEKAVEHFLQAGPDDLFFLAQNYNMIIAKKYRRGHIERRRAAEIFQAAGWLGDDWGEITKDYLRLSEHILPPKTHRAQASLRRQRQYLKTRSESVAQDLYGQINLLLPVLSFFASEERSRRQKRLFSLQKQEGVC